MRFALVSLAVCTGVAVGCGSASPTGELELRAVGGAPWLLPADAPDPPAELRGLSPMLQVKQAGGFGLPPRPGPSGLALPDSFGEALGGGGYPGTIGGGAGGRPTLPVGGVGSPVGAGGTGTPTLPLAGVGLGGGLSTGLDAALPLLCEFFAGYCDYIARCSTSESVRCGELTAQCPEFMGAVLAELGARGITAVPPQATSAIRCLIQGMRTQACSTDTSWLVDRLRACGVPVPDSKEGEGPPG